MKQHHKKPKTKTDAPRQSRAARATERHRETEMAGGLGLRELGGTGLKISSLGFGGSPLGNLFGSVKEEDAIASVHEAARLGINFFDVSP
jgi:hypothetical protein